MNFKLLILAVLVLACVKSVHLNREEHFANSTSCPSPSYFNTTSQTCTQCANGTQYNISTKSCQHFTCP